MKHNIYPLVIVAWGCATPSAYSNEDLGNDKLDTNLTDDTAHEVLSPSFEASPALPTAPSKIKKLVDKAQYVTQGAGVFGKNVKTKINKDSVGIQYSTKW